MLKKEAKTSKKKSTKKATKSYKKQPQKKNINYKKRRIIALTIVLIILLIITTILILFSSLFNIKSISVINNQKVSTDEIIQNSGLAINNNMFKTLNTKIKAGIKSNSYIENVKITKKLNGEVILNITERVPTFMLAKDDTYAYINNQGYILEISQTPLELPIIKGYETPELLAGKRIDVEDLKKLDTVIQIMETAKSNEIKQIITEIDISDLNNYILKIPSENKTVQFGDKTNINMKILWIKDIIEKEKGIEGEIIVNVPNIKKVYFREKV